MCECVKTPFITAGWMCHTCRTYNGLQRETCRHCGTTRCKPLSPDKESNEHFETYAEAYKDDPAQLKAIERAVAASEGN